MKTTFLFFFCVLLCISLNGMVNQANLDCIPTDLIIRMFPDDKDIYPGRIKLVNFFDTYKSEQVQEHNASLKDTKSLVAISMVNKKLHGMLLQAIEKRIIEKKINVQYVSANDICEYRKYSTFTNEPFSYYQEIFHEKWPINICSLTKKNAVLDGYYQCCGINYKPKSLVKNFKLDVFLTKDCAQNFTFTDNHLYDRLCDLCEEISEERCNDLHTLSTCKEVKQECAKKTLSIQAIDRFLRNLDYLNNLKNSIYFEKTLALLKLGIVRSPINLCFAFTFFDVNEEIKNLDVMTNSIEKHFIINTSENDGQEKNLTFDNLLFFNYIQKTFNNNPEKIKIITSACNNLLLKKCNGILNKGNYCINFEIQNNDNSMSMSMSDELVIPLDLLHFKRPKHNKK